MAGRKLLKDSNPELLREWNLDKNKGLDPNTINKSSNEEIWWNCSVDKKHQWKATVRRRVYNKTGCLYCAGKLVLREESFAEKHPDLMEEWDWEKNREIDPFELSCSSNKRANWICKNDPSHTWAVDIYHRSRNGSGCRKCSAKSRSSRKIKKLLIEAYPHIAKEWDYEKNIDIDINSITHGSSKYVWWKCSADEDHQWRSTVANRTGSHRGCIFCSGESPSEKNSLATIHPEVAEEWHLEKNHPLKPSDVTRASGQKVWWLCKNDPDHEWQAVVRNRTTLGSKCPECEKEIKLIRLRGYLLDSENVLSEQYKIFAKNLYSIEALLNEGEFSRDSYNKTFLRLAFSSAITSMETYLSDLFSEKVLINENRMNLLFKNADDFVNRKYSIEQAINFQSKKSKEAEKYIADVIWHNIPKANFLYQKVLGFSFDSSKTTEICKLVSVRHDIVHRNGRKKNGGLHSINKDSALNCIRKVKSFVEEIENAASSI